MCLPFFLQYLFYKADHISPTGSAAKSAGIMPSVLFAVHLLFEELLSTEDFMSSCYESTVSLTGLP
jgi:hypothetical protein